MRYRFNVSIQLVGAESYLPIGTIHFEDERSAARYIAAFLEKATKPGTFLWHRPNNQFSYVFPGERIINVRLNIVEHKNDGPGNLLNIGTMAVSENEPTEALNLFII